MVDSFKAIVVIVLLIVGFMVYPSLRLAERTEELAHQLASSSVQEFVDTVRGKGFVEVRDYDILQRKLDGSGMVFDIQLEHHRKTIQPHYVGGVFQNTFTIEYIGRFNVDILNRIYPVSGAAMAEPADSALRRYAMHAGDLFQVRVQSKGTSLSSRFRSMLFRSGSDVPIIITYGGMVRSEAP